MTLWMIAVVSGTSAMIVPLFICCPFSTFMVVSQSFFVSKADTLTPLFIKLPDSSAMLLRGLSIPSNILLSIPGASVTLIGAPKPSTDCPGFSPVVSSYTCMVQISPSSMITSPTSFKGPT